MHPSWEDGANHVVVRCFRPEAESVEVVDHDTLEVVAPLERRHPEGFYESVIPDCDATFAYLLRITNHDQHTYTLPDPYSFGPVLKDFDLHLVSEGSHQNLSDRMGANCIEHGGMRGKLFSV